MQYPVVAMIRAELSRRYPGPYWFDVAHTIMKHQKTLAAHKQTTGCACATAMVVNPQSRRDAALNTYSCQTKEDMSDG